MTRRSKDKVYTPFDKAADWLRDYKPSAKVSEALDAIGKTTLKTLGEILKNILSGKIKASAGKLALDVLKEHTKKVAKEIGKDIKGK